MRSLKLAGLAVALGLVFASSAAAASCTDEFIGENEGQWSKASNWSTGKKPGPSDVACWEPGRTVLVTEPANIGGGEVGAIQGGSLVLGGRNGIFIFGPGESDLTGSLTLEEQVDLKEFGGTRIFHVDGAIVDAPGKLEGEEGGIELTQGPGSTLMIGGGSQVEVDPGSSISTESPITIDNPEFNARGPITTTSTISFAPGVSIDPSRADATTFTAAGVAANSGPSYGFGGDPLVLTGGQTTVAAGTKLESGAIELKGGVLQDEGAIGGPAAEPSPVTLSGGTLAGTGTVNGPLNVITGTVAPGPRGRMTVLGAYDQEGGSLAFGIAGATPGSGFDQLLISGGAQFAGTLQATDEAGFSPAEGQTFKVVEGANSRSGTFASFTGASAALYMPEYESDGLTLRGHLPAALATPAPLTPTPGVASTPSAVAALLHGCSSSPLVLNDAYIHGSRVLLRGSAAAGYAGRTVSFLFNEKKTVAHAKVTADGSFTATAPLPPRKIRDALTTRYSAEIGKLRSLHLKLTRRLQLEPPTSNGHSVILKGRVELPLTKPVTPVIVEQQLECGKTTVTRTFTPSHNGRFDITLTVPAAAKAGIYTLKTKVAANAGTARRGFTTYSLPLPVLIG